jgi:small subunit ribosomal protein S17
MSTETSTSTEQSRRRELVGRVVSDKMDKTVTVEVVRTLRHRKYHKFISRRKKYHAHDENNEFKVDDVVVIQESRPLSKTKRWVVVGRR